MCTRVCICMQQSQGPILPQCELNPRIPYTEFSGIIKKQTQVRWKDTHTHTHTHTQRIGAVGPTRINAYARIVPADYRSPAHGHSNYLYTAMLQ